jgi:hypothetical protein
VELEFVDLDDDAVDFVLDAAPVLAVVLDEARGLGRGRRDPVMRARGQPPRSQQFVHLGLRGDGRAFPRADAVHEHPEPA